MRYLREQRKTVINHHINCNARNIRKTAQGCRRVKGQYI